MSTWFESALQYVHQHHTLGLVLAFVFAFLEALPLIGTLIPGSVTMTAVGALVGAGVLPGGITIFWTAVGAYLGDILGFGTGKTFKHKLHAIWPFTKHPHWLTKSETFFKSHGGKSIIIGRFVGPIRSTIPMVAGLLNMRWMIFLFAALLASIAWSIVYMLPGILLGALSVELPASKATEFMLIGLVIILLIWLILWLIRVSFSQLKSLINRQTDRLWAWLNTHHSSTWLIRAITNQQHPNDHRQLLYTLIAILCWLAFFIVYLNVIFKTHLLALNLPLYHFFQSLRTHNVDTFFILITIAAKSTFCLGIALLISLGLAWKKQWRAVTHLLVLIIANVICIFVFKHSYYSPRPEEFSLVDPSSSFPSGHTTSGLTLYGMLAFLMAQTLPKGRAWISYTTAAVLITLIAISRLYLGAHWFTDVLGSTFLGFGILLPVIVSYNRLPKPTSALNLKALPLLIIIGLGILIPWATYSSLKFEKKRSLYQPFTITVQASITEWWKNPLAYTPAYRDNRLGKPVQPFNVQWADQLSSIKNHLIQHGWEPLMHPGKLQSTVQRFASKKPEYHTPLLPWLYHHHKPALVLIKHVGENNAILELRLWESFVDFKESPLPLFIGTINLHKSRKSLWAFDKHNNVSFSSKIIFQTLQQSLNGYQHKIVVSTNPIISKRIKHLHWRGEILLVRPTKAMG